MIIREVEWDAADGSALRVAQRVELSARYGSPDSEPGVIPSAADITVFFVAYDDDGSAIGCGGLRRLTETEAEVKRMFVLPNHRGTGVSTAILDQLEVFGRENAYSRLVLETGDRQPDAVRFYQRQGYARIPNFGHYVGVAGSLCFEKVLAPSDPASAVDCEACQ
jgi:putative acetyltransferase